MMSRGMRFILSFLVMAVLISISGVALVYFLGRLWRETFLLAIG